MMNGQEKSDSGVVAAKPANKGGEPSAERVEPRPETKGNVGQQSTHRAQDRARVTQALDRVRKVAKARKKEQFTALLHHVSVDLLDEAFFDLKEDAAAGIDGLTWKEYELNLEENLEDLHARVHRGACRALPSRRVYIPKPDGRRRRSQKDRITWARMAKLADDFLPKPLILHPWPSDRFAVTHPR